LTSNYITALSFCDFAIQNAAIALQNAVQPIHVAISAIQEKHRDRFCYLSCFKPSIPSDWYLRRALWQPCPSFNRRSWPRNVAGNRMPLIEWQSSQCAAAVKPLLLLSNGPRARATSWPPAATGSGQGMLSYQHLKTRPHNVPTTSNNSSQFTLLRFRTLLRRFKTGNWRFRLKRRLRSGCAQPAARTGSFHDIGCR